MILADKIINERKKNGWSQEELARKLSVSRQSISKWESAQAVPDLQRILKMAEIFGVTTDYLLKDDIDVDSTDVSEFSASADGNGEPLRVITLEQAGEFVKNQKEVAPIIANAVSLCIVSPTALIVLAGLYDTMGFMSENLATGIGLFAMILSVAVAVYLFITASSKSTKFEYIKKETFETAYGVEGMAKREYEEYLPIRTRRIAFGVVLCILSVVPLIVCACINEKAEGLLIACLGIMFVAVAIGVNLIVRSSFVSGAYDKLLQRNDYTVDSKKAEKTVEKISGVYWPIVIAIYFIISFTKSNWGETWIIWPVSAILFSAVSAIIKLIGK